MAEITIRVSDKVLKMAGAGLVAVILAWGMIQVKSSGLFEPKYEVRMFTPEASGIREGTPVRLDGLPVGKVSSVRLAGNSADPNRRIELTLRIEKRFQDSIRTESAASFLTEGLLGERFVEIQRGFSGQVIGPQGEIRALKETTISPMDFLDALAKAVKAGDCKKDEEAGDGKKSEAGAVKATNRK